MDCAGAARSLPFEEVLPTLIDVDGPASLPLDEVRPMRDGGVVLGGVLLVVADSPTGPWTGA